MRGRCAGLPCVEEASESAGGGAVNGAWAVTAGSCARGSVSEVDGERDKATELPTRQFVLNHRQSAASAAAPHRGRGCSHCSTRRLRMDGYCCCRRCCCKLLARIVVVLETRVLVSTHVVYS